jgi:hypothetical protein
MVGDVLGSRVVGRVTLILGLEHRGKVHLLGDRISIDGNNVRTRCAAPKVFRLGCWAVGSAGSWRLLALLQRKFRPPKNSDAFDFVDELRAMVAREGIDEEPSEDSPVTWEVVFGCAGRVHYVDSLGSYVPPADGVAVAGADSAFVAVRAALMAQKPFKRSAEAHMRKAAQITAELSAEVMGPFDYISL